MGETAPRVVAPCVHQELNYSTKTEQLEHVVNETSMSARPDRNALATMWRNMSLTMQNRKALHRMHDDPSFQQLIATADSRKGMDRGLVYNMLVNPQGLRDRAVESAAWLAAPVAGSAMAGRGILTRLAPIVARTVSAAGAAGQTLENAEEATALRRVSEGTASEDEVRRVLAYLQQQSGDAGLAKPMADAWHEPGTSEQGTVQGKMGNLSDVAGALFGIQKTAYTQRMAGKNPFAPANAARNAARNATEAAVGLAGRYAENIPAIKKFANTTARGAAVGYVGGTLQNARPLDRSESQREALLAVQALRTKYPEWTR